MRDSALLRDVMESSIVVVVGSLTTVLHATGFCCMPLPATAAAAAAAAAAAVDVHMP